jgi:hypothetical protein
MLQMAALLNQSLQIALSQAMAAPVFETQARLHELELQGRATFKPSAPWLKVRPIGQSLLWRRPDRQFKAPCASCANLRRCPFTRSCVVVHLCHAGLVYFD